jgi:hypothetical protein
MTSLNIFGHWEGIRFEFASLNGFQILENLWQPISARPNGYIDRPGFKYRPCPAPSNHTWWLPTVSLTLRPWLPPTVFPIDPRALRPYTLARGHSGEPSSILASSRCSHSLLHSILHFRAHPAPHCTEAQRRHAGRHPPPPLKPGHHLVPCHRN